MTSSRNSTLFVSALIGFSAILIWCIGRWAISEELPGPDDEVLAIATQSNGDVVIGGRFMPNHIERRNSSGTPDTSFEASWVTGGFNRDVWGLTIDSYDRVIAVGEFTNFDTSICGYITRLLPDGSIDADFARNIGTGFDDAAYTVEIIADGRIAIGGSFTSFNGIEVASAAILNDDGTLDTKFSPGSKINGTVYSLATDGLGGLIVGGELTTNDPEPSTNLTWLSTQESP